MPWQNDSSDSGPVGAAQHRSQVARIGHAVTHQQEGTIVDQRLEPGGGQASGVGDDALVALSARLAVQTGHRDDRNRHALALSLTLDLVEHLGGVLLIRDQDALDGPSARAQEFEHRSSALDLLTAESLVDGAPGRRARVGGARTAPMRAAGGAGTGAGRHDSSSIRATARAPMPSARPRAPRPSVVVALTETREPTTPERAWLIAGM